MSEKLVNILYEDILHRGYLPTFVLYKLKTSANVECILLIYVHMKALKYKQIGKLILLYSSNVRAVFDFVCHGNVGTIE